METNKYLIPFDCMNQHHNESNNSYDGAEQKEKNILGIKITEARRKLSLSQKALSDLMAQCNAKATSGTLSKWEKGDTTPNAYQLFALCYCLQIDDVLSYFTGKIPKSSDFSPELSQKGLNLLQLFKNTLVSSGQYAPRSRRAFAEPEAEIAKPVYDEPLPQSPDSLISWVPMK